MRKTFLGLMLLAALALQAQTTSRIMLGLGGGLSTGASDGRYENNVCPMGTFHFGYAIYNTVNRDLMLGFRTGLGATYNQIGMSAKLDETFTNEDYYGHQLDYTVEGKVNYKQKQFNLELPLMFAIDGKGVVFNIGTKLIFPLLNKYTQTISNPVVTAYYGDFGVPVVNDIATGIISKEQCNLSGKADLPMVMFSFSVELGYIWNLKNNNKLGLDLFVDYVPGGVGGTKAGDQQIVEIGNIVNDCFQPTAPVTVNTMANCYNYKYKYVNAGVKLVWAFDIKHMRKMRR